MVVTRVDGCSGLVLSERVAERVTADTIRLGNLTCYREKVGIERKPAIWAYKWSERKTPQPAKGWR